MYTIYKHKLVKGMDDAILQEMSNDFMNMIQIYLTVQPLALLPLPWTLRLYKPKFNYIESLVNAPNLLSALLSPEIDLPPDIANFINNIPVATDNTILYCKQFL